MQRSLSLLRRMHGVRIIPYKSTANPSLFRPQYIAIRTYFNPDGDYMELSETAWKEKRLYRYYKFSNNLSVTQQGRGYAQGVFVIVAFWTMFWGLCWIDIQTCFQYRHLRTMRDEVYYPWFRLAKKAGYWTGFGFSRKKWDEMMDEELPEIAKKHDAPTKRTWKKDMCLAECLKREKNFDSPYHFNQVHNDFPPMAHPVYLEWLKKEEEKKGIAQLD